MKAKPERDANVLCRHPRELPRQLPVTKDSIMKTLSFISQKSAQETQERS